MMFTQEQLEFIKHAARKTKNQGEIAVWKFLAQQDKDNAGRDQDHYEPMFTIPQWGILKYCAEECKRQHSGEMSVYDMVNAWNFAYNRWHLHNVDYVPIGRPIEINKEFIEEIGKLVEPIDNKKGFRTVAVGVMDNGIWHEKEHWRDVPYMLEVTLDAYYHGMLSPEYAYALVPNHELAKSAEDQFYYEYENIHPFLDGNGRSGKILYNYLNGTLDNPIMPPNFWGSSNP